MPTAKKLPSGSWRVQVYSHRDGSGKRHYESFTAPTKKAAELQALEWSNQSDRKKQSQITVGEAIEGPYCGCVLGAVLSYLDHRYRVCYQASGHPCATDIWLIFTL